QLADIVRSPAFDVTEDDHVALRRRQLFYRGLQRVERLRPLRCSSGSSSQRAGGLAQWPGQRACCWSKKRFGSTEDSSSSASPDGRAESGTVRLSRSARVFAVLARMRKIQVFREERSSKRW